MSGRVFPSYTRGARYTLHTTQVLPPMTTVVQSSNSVSSTFLSTLDHLPCDVVRSLWLVQACNIRVEKEKHKLHELFQKHQYDQAHLPPSSEAIAKVFAASRGAMTQANKESVAELQSLYTQLKSHHSMLKGSLDQLESDVEQKSHDLAAQKNLRQQLMNHYERNPLTSREEALQERVLKESGKVIIKRANGGATGIRIILNSSKGKDKSNINPEKGVEGISAVAKDRPRRMSSPRTMGNPRESNSSNPTPTDSIVPAKKNASPVEPSSRTHVELEVEIYCFCQQPSFGDMIGCDNFKCKNGEWFHYKCVGLNRVKAMRYAKQKWYCSKQCKEEAEAKRMRKRRRKANNW